MSPRVQVRLFLVLAVVEAFSWAGLLIGMYAKYLTDLGDLGVKVFGPIHGGVFVAYALMTLVLSRTLSWSRRTTVAGLACAVPPFATLAFELWAQRTGRLSPPEPADRAAEERQSALLRP